MTEGHPGAAILLDQYRAMVASDTEGVVRHFADEIYYEEPSLGVVAHTPDEVARVYQPWFDYVDFTFPTLDAFGSQRRAALRWEMHGTIRKEMPEVLPPDAVGKSFTLVGVTVAEFDGGLRIVRCGCYWDRGSLTRQF
ncbi:nuclear transport factor 2 family protein [Streptomyces sp. NPDC050504]|uniref:nuclear transport factor 2 family protein n=1 Tax=Streptomyces sp. NPDC050504 TaxID=3365618 RepID=UPI0037973F27